MSGYLSILTILGIILIALLFLFLIIKRVRKLKVSPYEEALIALIDGEEKLALKKFQETVFEDSDNVEAYIRLAELLRKMKDPLKALQIHKYLLARRRLPKKTINRILFQTANDYIVLKSFEKAIDILKKLLRVESQNEQYYKLLLLTYEKSFLWNDAMDIFRKMSKLFSYPKENLFKYEVCAAYEANKKGDSNLAKKVLNRVLKMEPENIPALIYLGDIEYSNGNIDAAIKLYNSIINIDSRSGHIVFPRLTKTYFEKGEYQKIEEAYKTVLEKLPEDKRTIVSLTDYYLKMGRLNEAQELIKNGIESHPDSIEMNLFFLLTDLELKKSESVGKLRHIIDNYINRGQFRCNKCGSISKEFIIRCPECNEWDTFEIERII